MQIVTPMQGPVDKNKSCHWTSKHFIYIQNNLMKKWTLNIE